MQDERSFECADSISGLDFRRLVLDPKSFKGLRRRLAVILNGLKLLTDGGDAQNEKESILREKEGEKNV